MIVQRCHIIEKMTACITKTKIIKINHFLPPSLPPIFFSFLPLRPCSSLLSLPSFLLHALLGSFLDLIYVVFIKSSSKFQDYDYVFLRKKHIHASEITSKIKSFATTSQFRKCYINSVNFLRHSSI